MCFAIERDQETMEARKEQGEKQRLQHHQEDEVKKKRHQKQVIEMEKMKEHLTG